jgi:AbrB family looped-hinge helix DNA binding protein
VADTIYATLTSKGQLTLPRELRNEWGLKPGDQIGFSRSGERKAVVEPRRRRSIFEGLDELTVREAGPPLTKAVVRKAAANAVAATERRIRAGRK